jgi:hypothetical protein
MTLGRQIDNVLVRARCAPSRQAVMIGVVDADPDPATSRIDYAIAARSARGVRPYSWR